jgi:pimeloyl-ACP methyl ester carboxylesterase
MISEQPTVVLLHGAGAGAWIWQRVIDRLREPGVALDVPQAFWPLACRGGWVADLSGAFSCPPSCHRLAGRS